MGITNVQIQRMDNAFKAYNANKLGYINLVATLNIIEYERKRMFL